MKKIFFYLILILLLFSLSQNASASSFLQGLQNTGQKVTAYGGNYVSPEILAANIVKTLLTLVGVVFVALLIYGGFLYMTSGGGEKVKKAKGAITTAVIGLAIIITGYSITYFIALQLESPGAGPPAFNEACENPGELDYFSINCCYYRVQKYPSSTPDSRCCAQQPGLTGCPH